MSFLRDSLRGRTLPPGLTPWTCLFTLCGCVLVALASSVIDQIWFSPTYFVGGASLIYSLMAWSDAGGGRPPHVGRFASKICFYEVWISG